MAHRELAQPPFQARRDLAQPRQQVFGVEQLEIERPPST
jgi:hypothetical protein